MVATPPSYKCDKDAMTIRVRVAESRALPTRPHSLGWLAERKPISDTQQHLSHAAKHSDKKNLPSKDLGNTPQAHTANASDERYSRKCLYKNGPSPEEDGPPKKTGTLAIELLLNLIKLVADHQLVRTVGKLSNPTVAIVKAIAKEDSIEVLVPQHKADGITKPVGDPHPNHISESNLDIRIELERLRVSVFQHQSRFQFKVLRKW